MPLRSMALRIPQRAFAKKSIKEEKKEKFKEDKKAAGVPKEITFDDIESASSQIVASHVADLKLLKAGKPTAETFSVISVPAYGEVQRLQSMAQVTPLTPSTFQITPFDVSLIPDIVKAIEKEKVHELQVQAEEERIIVNVSGENASAALAKITKKLKEDAEVVRHKLREERKNKLQSLKKFEKFIEQDVYRQALAEVEKIYTKFSGELDKAVKAKEKEFTK